MARSIERPQFTDDSSNRRGAKAALQLLQSLIPLLIRYGVTHDQLALVSRKAFVQSAAGVARLRNGRVNQSQVAASTGLTRAEVRKHLAALELGAAYPSASKSKIARVLQGWKTDKRFCSASGKPKPLQFSGRGSSFASLVRAYGRDVPPRAMAAELARQGRIETQKNVVTLRTTGKSSRDRNEAELAQRVTAINAIASSLNFTTSSASAPTTRFVTIDANDAIERGIVWQRVEDIVGGATAALLALQGNSLTGRRPRRSKAAFGVRVALVVSESERHSERFAVLRSSHKLRSK